MKNSQPLFLLLVVKQRNYTRLICLSSYVVIPSLHNITRDKWRRAEIAAFRLTWASWGPIDFFIDAGWRGWRGWCGCCAAGGGKENTCTAPDYGVQDAKQCGCERGGIGLRGWQSSLAKSSAQCFKAKKFANDRWFHGRQKLWSQRTVFESRPGRWKLLRQPRQQQQDHPVQQILRPTNGYLTNELFIVEQDANLVKKL